MTHRCPPPVLIVVWCLLFGSIASAQTGASDDRVSLPEGPGSLEGVGENVDINPNMGSMQYSVGISVPRGFASVTPSLSLSYSSSGGTSAVGMGWSMMTPCIERMTYRGLPEYDTEDDFAADMGTQLIRLPGTEPAMYRARYEGGFVRYTWMDEGDGSEGYWIAEHPDGSRAYFGADAQGNLVPEARVSGDAGTFRYHMVEKVDVYGHRMVFDYIKDGPTSLLSQVSYVFTEGPDIPTYAVSLAYEDRADNTGSESISDLKPGFEERLTQRLTHVHVLTRGLRVRSYALSYETYAASGGMTLLKSVERLGSTGEQYPIAHRFEYAMPEDTGRPFTLEMGSLGVAFGSKRATLVDINGDGLPDIVDASQEGAHRLFYNIAQADGSARFDPNFVQSALGTRTSHPLEAATVQVLDVNGDGFTDLLNAGTGVILVNRGNGDWEQSANGSGISALAEALTGDFDADEGELQALKFIDYDNDKRIDVMKSTQFETTVFHNRGEAGFDVDEGVDTLGFGFAEDGVQFADMNGDGLLDVVRVRLGFIQFRLNKGFGRWAETVVIEGLPIEEQRQIDLVEMEDINGDGLADLVLVDGESVSFTLNRNASEFGPVQTLDSDGVDGTIPLRDSGTTVLYADMNANGSSDIVWISAGGEVTALELFPVRPNLMTRITNDIGQSDRIVYTTAAIQMALSGGWESWRHKLPYAMNIVGSLIQTDLLSNNPEAIQYRYSDGFYDGEEKQFRGFATVEVSAPGDAHHEDGLQRLTYEVGAEDIYRKNLQLSETTLSDGRVLSVSETTYEDCPLDGIPEGTDLPIRFVCPTAGRTTVQEGRPEDEWVVMETQTEYDGYGNITRSTDRGVVSIGGGSCAACGDRGPDDFGAPCGNQCIGDETTTETAFVPPSNTGGLWLLRAPFRSVTYGREGSELATETQTFYDGDPFEGLPLGNLTTGNATRVADRVSSDRFIQVQRSRFDAHGNVVDALDPLGSPDGTTHRRTSVFDEDGLRIVQTDDHLEDPEGNPYTLRQQFTFEPRFDRMATATDWMVFKDGESRSDPRLSRFEYDAFGRMTSRLLPGDDGEQTEIYSYSIQSPASRIAVGRRSESGGALDLEAFRCMDGRGRLYQRFEKIDEGRYQASGFAVFNIRSKLLRFYQPYVTQNPDCATAPPEGVPFIETRYDAQGRVVEMTHPDESIYGTASTNRTEHLPLRTIIYDVEDLDPNSPHFDTPVTQNHDGLGRLTSVERLLDAQGPPIVSHNHYDSLGRLIGFTDPGNHHKAQRYDLLGRLTEIHDPDTDGIVTHEYDDASNVVRTMDERGIIVQNTHDGLNRIVETWDEDDRDGTLLTYTFDTPTACDPSACTHTPRKIAETTFPGLNGDRWADSYGYDARGQLAYTARRIGGFTFERHSAFDNVSRATSAAYPDGSTVSRRFDSADRTIAIDGIIDTITYDDRDLVDTVRLADGTVRAFTYDALMRPLTTTVTDPSGDILQGFGYTLGRLGRIEAVEDLAGNPLSFEASYTYDALYRLTRAELGDGSETLTYQVDVAGNLTERTSTASDTGDLALGALTYGEGAGPHAVTTAGGTPLAYDPAGNATQRGDLSMTWDFRGKLRRTEGPGVDTHALYSAGQDRVARIDGDSTSLYPFADFIVRDGISALYIIEGGRRIARIESDALATTLLTDHDDDGQINAHDAWRAHEVARGESGPPLWSSVRRLMLETGPEDGRTFLHHDHQGNITMATSGDGEQVRLEGARAFRPYGTVRNEVGFVDPFGVTGQEGDPSGFVHFLHREYDPRIGRWASIDPAWFGATADNILARDQGTAGYAYLSGEPINAFDVDGLADKIVLYVGFDPNAESTTQDQYLNDAVDFYKGNNRYDNDKMGSVRKNSSSGSLKNSGITNNKKNVLVLVAHASYDGKRMGTDSEQFDALGLVDKLAEEGLEPGDLNNLTIELHGCLTGSVCKVNDPKNNKAFMDRFIKAMTQRNFTNFNVKGALGTMTGDRKVNGDASADHAQTHQGSGTPWSNSQAHRTVSVKPGKLFGNNKKQVSGSQSETTQVKDRIKTTVKQK